MGFILEMIKDLILNLYKDEKTIHTLVYTYEIPVSLDEHLICLKPRSNSFQELFDFQLKIMIILCGPLSHTYNFKSVILEFQY